MVDESIIAYQPGADVKAKAAVKGEPIPVIYIPRKPHPNRLELFICASFINNPAKVGGVIPFILNILPHLKVGDVSPVESVRQVMKR